MINLGYVIGDICGSVYEFKEVTTPHTDLNLFEYGSQKFPSMSFLILGSFL